VFIERGRETNDVMSDDPFGWGWEARHNEEIWLWKRVMAASHGRAGDTARKSPRGCASGYSEATNPPLAGQIRSKDPEKGNG
jgi:hypothetical protein